VKKLQRTIAIENQRLDLLIVQIFSNLVSDLLNKDEKNQLKKIKNRKKMLLALFTLIETERK
jgi:hypothetical protein